MERGCRRSRLVAGVISLAAAFVAVALLVKGLYPTDLPANRHPDYIDNIFDNRGVLWAARMLLVSAAAVLAFGGVFIVVSIGIRMKNGEWLRRAGPFEISVDPFSRAEEEAAYWHRVALASHEEVSGLRDQVQRYKELVGDLEKG